MYPNTDKNYPIGSHIEKKNFPMNRRVSDKSIYEYTVDTNRYIIEHKCNQNIIGMFQRRRPIPDVESTDIHSDLLSLDRKLSRVPEKKQPSCYTKAGACVCKKCIESNCANKIVYYRDPVDYKNCYIDADGKFYCK